MTNRIEVQVLNERVEVQDPSLICFVAKLMELAKDGYGMDTQNYPNMFGGLYHTVVLKAEVSLAEGEHNPVVEETFAEIVPPDNNQAAAKRGPKPKGK